MFSLNRIPYCLDIYSHWSIISLQRLFTTLLLALFGSYSLFTIILLKVDYCLRNFPPFPTLLYTILRNFIATSLQSTFHKRFPDLTSLGNLPISSVAKCKQLYKQLNRVQSVKRHDFREINC